MNSQNIWKKVVGSVLINFSFFFRIYTQLCLCMNNYVEILDMLLVPFSINGLKGIKAKTQHAQFISCNVVDDMQNIFPQR